MPGIIERRFLDDRAITGNNVFSVDLGNAKTIVSVLHVKSIMGTPTTMSLIVTVYRLDPGTKKKLGAAIITHTTVTEATGFPFLEDKDVADVTTARFTGLFRVEIALSFTGGTSPSAVPTLTLIGKE